MSLNVSYFWIKLFGIGNANPEQTDQLLAEEGFSVFTVSKRKYLGDAGGAWLIINIEKLYYIINNNNYYYLIIFIYYK